jgi:ATP-dependent Clp protease adaptor protein ClpS
MLKSDLWPYLATDVERELDRGLDTAESLESMWRVFIHNDDVTPYDFVVSVLQRIFELEPPAAELVTFTAHSAGIAYVATLPKTEAQQRVGKAHFAASLEGFPLTFTIEPE